MLFPITECPTNPLITFQDITVRNTTMHGSILPPGVIRCPPENPCYGINFEDVIYHGLWRWFGPGYFTTNAYGTVKNSHPHPGIIDENGPV